MKLLSSARLVLVAVFGSSAVASGAQDAKSGGDPAQYAREHYVKREVRIPMRDGVELFAAVYSPKEAGTKGAGTYPILLNRTPYSVGPYGAEKFKTVIGPSESAMKEGFIVVYEDVRGCYMSGGEFVDVRPQLGEKSAKDGKGGKLPIDESTDAWDTIEWLVKNVAGNNLRVGMWGISYPGFYAAAGMIDAHPSLVAVSPQAPIADWWYDDFHHHGAFFLPHAFNFLSGFGRPRPEPVPEKKPSGFEHGTKDGYEFFLNVGPLSEVNRRWFKGEVKFWDDLVQHPNYDDFWSARNLQPHLKRVAPAVMTVGGWFDAEDLYGALHTYQAVEAQNPGITNVLVMGPWQHGGWSRVDGDRLGNVSFGEKTAVYYREQLELVFFNRNLKSKYDGDLAEATLFETGANRWRTFDAWPPAGRQWRYLAFHANGALEIEPLTKPNAQGSEPTKATGTDKTKAAGTEKTNATATDGTKLAATDARGWDEFISDPAHPVPFTESVAIGMTKEYMTDDQRFASRRPDVLTYRTEPLTDSVTLAGSLDAQLWISTDQTDCDWIVKLIDVFPPDAKNPDWMPPTESMGGYEMLVRSEVLRGRFRDGYSEPKPFEPGVPTLVRVPLQDVLHTFLKGHRIMIQVQSTWFPLVDRNPQKFLPNMFEARPEDCVKATHRVYREGERTSRVLISTLP